MKNVLHHQAVAFPDLQACACFFSLSRCCRDISGKYCLTAQQRLSIILALPVKISPQLYSIYILPVIPIS